MRILNNPELQQVAGGTPPFPNGTYIGQTYWFEGTTYYWETYLVAGEGGSEGTFVTGWATPVYDESHNQIGWQGA
ncbi:hypothetical protein SAMN02745857_03658 [Andreprevotia lacus DSM 23236]|jgi:hypothetical protein|uniref:Uncharacterized protein n=1 Tax=Andreprevotia lacus DSM 23236 TaxID=1121001 RepID=A0A1W1XYY6_9NEIS|nr:hypothetical protein [Andreprevotia lacus]SMC29180.1 hypothetical protein SAMN02745857_03658 [Andreprevotia lacus DSM 23236]